MYFPYLVLLIGACLSVWGSQSKGEWGWNISVVGGLIWIGSILYLFVKLRFSEALVSIIASVILGGVLQKIIPKSA